jgi:hypothetical protein
MREPASVRSAPLAITRSSWAASAANLFGADVNGSPVSSASLRATASPKPAGALSPVPTAVPPIASARRPGSVASIRAILASS